MTRSNLLIHLGFNSFIIRDRVKSVFSSEHSGMRKRKTLAGQEEMVINLTYGYEMKSIILMDSGHIILSVVPLDAFIQEFLKGS